MLALSSSEASLESIRFYGTGPNWMAPYIDRIRVNVDAGTGSTFPANVGAGDFTIEMFLYALSGNDAAAITAGANNNWINGNIICDRDRFSQNNAFGMSLGAGIPAFGVTDSAATQRTIVGTTDIRNAWYHVAFVRDISLSTTEIFVGLPGQTGNREATSALAGNGSLEYPDDSTPNSLCGTSPTADGEPFTVACTDSDPYMVFGAEKHDAGAAFPSYFGYMTEVRVSDSVRYSGATYSAPGSRFTPDGNTVWLGHFNEPSGTTVFDSTGNARNGAMEVGGPSSGPTRSTFSPF